MTPPRTRRHRRAVALGLVTLFVAACGGDDKAAPTTTAGGSTSTATASSTAASGAPTESSSSPSSDAPAIEHCDATVPGSVMNFAGYAPSASLDPLQSSGGLVGGTELIAIYDTLMKYDRESGKWNPNVAESLTPNGAFTVWTLKLRSEVKYANGEPMLAQHVLDNLKRMLGPGRNGARAMVAFVDLDKSKAIDAQTAEIHLTKPWSAFAFLLGDSPGWIVNPTLGAAMDAAGKSVIGTDPKGAGAGPYEVVRYAPGESPYLVVKARPDYWGAAPCIETINFLALPSDQQKLDALETGEIDVAFLREGPIVDQARQAGYAESLEKQSSGQVVMINMKDAGHNPITNDVRFRKAVYNAMDNNVIRDRAYGGKLLTQEGLIGDDSRFATPGLTAPKRDPEVAKQLVSELKAGGWDGKIKLNASNINPDISIVLKSLLDAVGMDVELNVTDTNTNIAQMVAGEFDLNLGGVSAGDSTIWRAMSLNFYSTSASNRIGFKSAEMDAGIDALFAANDLAAQQAAVAKISKVYTDEVPMVSYGEIEEGIFRQKTVTGLTHLQQSMFYVADAKIDK